MSYAFMGYSPGALRSLSRSFRLERLLAEGERGKVNSIIARISEELAEHTFEMSALRMVNIRGKPAMTTCEYSTALALRAASASLRKSHPFVTTDRHSIVRTTRMLLGEASHAAIVRTDISDFYRSVNVKTIERQLETRTSQDSTSLWLIRAMFARASELGVVGLPRGLPTSAVLSEIFLTSIDRRIRAIRGVYFYARYVDDMIVFSSGSGEELVDRIGEILNASNLSLNTSPPKHAIVKVGHSLADSDDLFSLLGYQFGKNGNRVELQLSGKRFSRIKQRVYSCFVDYAQKRDFDFLLAGIRHLTRNSLIESSRTGRRVLTGVYYNNRHLTEKPPAQLSSLDRFVEALVFTRRGKIGEAMKSLSRKDRIRIARLKFVDGFEKKIFVNTNPHALNRLKKIWLHA